MTLERILHHQGFGSRKQCRALVLNGQVQVNGQACDDPQAQFALDGLQYTVNGQAWAYREKAYLLMHKPAHVECSHKPGRYPSLYSLLPPPLVLRGVQCIGRLDEDTTGLILLSDDGAFIHRMSSPKHKVPKVYEVLCKHPVSDAQLLQLTQGVQLVDEEGLTAAVDCTRVSQRVLHLTLAEGKYHQVKRMVAAISNRVEGLKRVRMGRLELPAGLKPGQWVWLDDASLEKLRPEQASVG